MQSNLFAIAATEIAALRAALLKAYSRGLEDGRREALPDAPQPSTALAEQSRLNAEAYRRGVEDAAKVADLYGQGRQGIAASKAIIAAIRSLSADKEGAPDT